MLILAFDTAQGALSAALLEDGNVLAHRFETRSRGHAETLLPLLADILEDAHCTLVDVTALAVTIGPGTFTGLRAGLATARGLALAKALPLVGVTTLEAVAAPVEAKADEHIVAAFDARREEIYLQIFNAFHDPVSDPLLLSVEDAQQKLSGFSCVTVGTGAPLLGHHQTVRLADAPPQPDALHVAHLAARRLHDRGREAFLKAPAPLYLRLPDAKLPGGLSLDAPGPHS